LTDRLPDDRMARRRRRCAVGGSASRAELPWMLRHADGVAVRFRRHEPAMGRGVEHPRIARKGAATRTSTGAGRRWRAAGCWWDPDTAQRMLAIRSEGLSLRSDTQFIRLNTF